MAGLAALAAVSVIAAVAVGSVHIPARDILAILADRLFGAGLPEGFSTVYPSMVMDMRLPRVLLAFLTGAALAMSGTVMQSLLQNPLASPFSLGVSSGAGLGAAIVIVTGLASGAGRMFLLPAVSLAFGLGTVFFVLWAAGRIDKGMSNLTIILIGMVASLFFNALMSLLATLSPAYAQRVNLWLLGSFSMREWARVWVLLPVSFVGVIGFVDLIAPHVVRRFFGAGHRKVLPASALFGGTFMVLCDLAARTIAPPREIPIGSITALLGAPFFLYIYFAGRRRRSE